MFVPTSHLLRRYTEALALFKPPQDSLWYASALEGMATIQILDAWSAGHGPVRSFVCQYDFPIMLKTCA